MQENRIDIITPGCAKNLVDSEKLQRSFFGKRDTSAYLMSTDLINIIMLRNTINIPL